jgi:hypothetical protein
MLPEVKEVIEAEIAAACGNTGSISVARMFDLASLLEDAQLPAWAERAMICAEAACRT